MRYRKRWDKGCVLNRKEREQVHDAIDRLPSVARRQTQLSVRTLDVLPLSGARVKGVWRLKLPPFRVIFVPANDQILVLHLERRHDHSYKNVHDLDRSYDNVEGLDRFVVTRRGRGVHVIEVPDRAHSQTESERPRSARAAVMRERNNPLTIIDTTRLMQLDLDRDSIKMIRTLAPSIDIAEVLAARGLDPDVVELVADVWHDPGRYLTIFGQGRVPTIEDAHIHEDELVERLRSEDSASSVAALDRRAFEAVLDGSIEEWMFYLHPSQTRIVRHAANGPSRVQGGPGTGKTVAALHRARHLAQTGQAERILLTTFVNLLPGVWRALLRSFAADVEKAITTRTVDALAREIVVGRDGVPTAILSSGSTERKRILERVIAQTPGLRDVIGTPANLEREIDEVIAGRGLDRALYLEVVREGRGTALRVAERQVVWAGYEHYRDALEAQGVTDWPMLRLRGLELARSGHGPRFDAVIVDEAQDLTEVQVRLLMELDTSPGNRGLMLVGDGRQAIYPGGFRLAHIGLRVAGRSFVLRTNWRNTQWIAEVAQAAFGESAFVDLETGEQKQPSAEQPLPLRLGEPPQLHVVKGSADGGEVLTMLIEEALKSGSLGDIGVLSRTRKTFDWAESVLRASGHAVVRLDHYKGQRVDAIRVGTFAKSKGLEFKLAILVGAGKDGWSVRPYWLRDEGEIDEWWATELRTFYVAMTRARDRLAVISGPDLAPPVDRAREFFDEWDWR